MDDLYTKEIKDLDELWKILHEHVSRGTYIYRGVSDSSLDLTPSIFRKTHSSIIFEEYSKNFILDDEITFEAHSISMYKTLSTFASFSNFNGLPILMDPLYKKMINNSANSYKQLKEREFWESTDNNYCLYPSDKYLDLMAVCQHYGLPTELLDFTVNPYTALYFGIHNLLHEFYNKKDLSKLYDGSIAMWFANYDVIQHKMETVKDFPLRSYVSVYANNPNLNSQKGIFLYWKHRFKPNDFIEKVPIDMLFKKSPYYRDDIFSKLIIPVKYIFDIYEVLARFNHVADSLFAGYTGVELRMSEDAIIRDLKSSITISKMLYSDLLRGK